MADQTHEIDFQAQASKALLAHGFLPDNDFKELLWKKEGRKLWAIASYDDESPMVHLTAYRVDTDDECVFETTIDFTKITDDEIGILFKSFEF